MEPDNIQKQWPASWQGYSQSQQCCIIKCFLHQANRLFKSWALKRPLFHFWRSKMGRQGWTPHFHQHTLAVHGMDNSFHSKKRQSIPFTSYSLLFGITHSAFFLKWFSKMWLIILIWNLPELYHFPSNYWAQNARKLVWDLRVNHSYGGVRKGKQDSPCENQSSDLPPQFYN